MTSNPTPRPPTHRIRRFTGALALLASGAFTPPAAYAQLGTPAATPAATAASGTRATPPLRPVPNLTNPSDAQRSMDLNNEQAGGKVVPQVRIPLGKNAGPPVFERRRNTAPAASAPSVPIDDAAARCDASPDKQSRAGCRSGLGKS